MSAPFPSAGIESAALDALCEDAAHADPAGWAWMLGWPARCDAAAVAGLRRTVEELAEEAREEMARRRAEDVARRTAEARRREEMAREEMARAPGALSREERARRYLGRIDGGPGGAWRAALALVRRFRVDEEIALAMLLADFAPRYHRALPRRELLGIVRRAGRARLVGGDLG